MTTAQADREKAEAQRLVEEQRAINAQQAEANRKLQEQVARLKPQEFTLVEGTIIPVRTSSELSTANLSNGSTFDGLLESDVKAGQTVVAKAGARVTCVVVSRRTVTRRAPKPPARRMRSGPVSRPVWAPSSAALREADRERRKAQARAPRLASA
jgi:hypothetical protein